MTNKTTDLLSNDHKSNDQPGGSLLQHIWASIGATLVLGIICCGIYPAAIWGISQLIFPVQANGSLLKKDGSFTTKADEAVGSALIGQNFSAPQYFQPRLSAAGNGYDATSSGGSNLGPLSDKLINGLTTYPTQPAPQPVPQPVSQPVPQPVSQPAESLTYDGIRLRTIHYAANNGLLFKLFTQRADGIGPKAEVPIKQFEDVQGNLLDVNLVDAFPHPPTDKPDRMVVVAADFATSDGNPVLIPSDAVTASGSGLDPHISPANAGLQINRVAAARHISPDQTRALLRQYTDGPDLGILGDPGVNVLRLNLALDAKYPTTTSK